MFSMKALNFTLAGILSMGLLAAPAFAESDVVLHSFQGPPNDGAAPYASLINVDGVFYGTTIVGGANNAGTVFKMTTAGVVKVLHSFGSGNDGAEPTGGLIAVGGELYAPRTEAAVPAVAAAAAARCSR